MAEAVVVVAAAAVSREDARARSFGSFRASSPFLPSVQTLHPHLLSPLFAALGPA